jgi:hypothetical protein
MNRIARSFKVLLVVAAAVTVGACASSPIDRKADTAQAARDVGRDLQVTQNQIDTTLSSLKTLVSDSSTPSRTAFDRYSEDVDKMRALAKTVDKEMVDIRKEGQAYLAHWEASHGKIENEELRQASEQRRRAILDHLQSMDQSYNRTGAPLDAFIRNLEDVKTALGNDFTEQGISIVSATNVVKDAEANGAKAKDALKQMHSDSSAFADTLPVEPSLQSSAAQ